MTRHRRALRALEGVPIELPAAVRDELLDEAEKIAASLNLRVGGVTRLRGGGRFDNLIGTIATANAELEIRPKTQPGDDWIRSVLGLIDDQPLVAAGDTSANDAKHRRSLLDAMASAFATRVSSALRREGSPTIIGRQRETSSTLRGRLDITRWVNRAAFEPHLFPVEHQQLTVANDYARALSYVANTLARATRNPRTRNELDRAASQLLPGHGIPTEPPVNAIGLALPEQWRVYAPAWRIAQLVLAQRSPLGRRDAPHGMSIAIEPWPLLERLLERVLARLATDLRAEGTNARSKSQSVAQFIQRIGQSSATFQYLRPDALMLVDETPVANFEAKYRDFASRNRPLRSECYQAMAASRAVGSPLAVLVYPNRLEAKRWRVLQAGNAPAQLVAIGMDMFSYLPGAGDKERADQLKTVFENGQGTDTMPLEETMA